MVEKYITYINERKISYNKKLCPDLWDDDTLNDKIRNKLFRISKDFFDEMELEVDLIDIYLIGSISNYNYNPSSDIDVHIIIDFNDINEDKELVKKAVDGQRFMWNLRHNINIKGHDVELYVQDVNEKNASTGIYSILNDEWVKRPVYKRPNVEQEDVDNKFDIRSSDIDKFEKLSKKDLDSDESETYHDAAKLLKSKIMKARKEGLDIIGEFSIENLVFKKLRKTGKFKKLIDTISRLYDKIYSQE